MLERQEILGGTPAGVYKMSRVGGEEEVGQDRTRIGTVNYSCC